VLLGVVVGDALGAPFEGHVGGVPAARLTELLVGSEPLRYTDDTALTIALAQHLIEGGSLADGDELLRSYARQWALDPTRGYSRGTASLLATFRAGGPGRGAIDLPRRASNGAAMRVAPVAVRPASPSTVLDLARRSAQATHAHPEAQLYACVQAIAVHLALHRPAGVALDGDRYLTEISEWIADPDVDRRLRAVRRLTRSPTPERIAAELGTGIWARESVPAAICAAVVHAGSFVDAVSLAIRLGGDTDTTASMTGAISGALLGETAIPAPWLGRVEGTDLLRRIGDELFERQCAPGLAHRPAT
jgi:poly(ADP-ribose) glycohydrolase ARH3